LKYPGVVLSRSGETSIMGEKIIGILGGMGPEATADLFHRIIRATPVKRDQDHVRTIIYSDSKIPDRTPAVFGRGEDPVPEMLMAGKALEGAGADFLIIPCNTAHYFIARLREKLGIPVLHMIEMTAEMVGKELPQVKRAGLIASDGTLKSGIYDKFFNNVGVEILAPSDEMQKEAMRAIYEYIKTGNLEEGRRLVMKISESLMESGADMLICGCTEISLVLKDGDITVPVVDPLQVLAETAIQIGLGKKEL
jgi:aspartate racemase